MILGLDIGGTKCAVILGKENASRGDAIVDRISFVTEVKKGVGQTVDNFFSSIDEILGRNGLNPSGLTGIGISCGGPLDSAAGVILSPPNLYGWDNIPITDIIEKRYNVKTRLQNDANACAVAEWRYGAARGTRNAVFITMGTGLGAGLILDGRLYSGTNDMAGEVGHARLSPIGPVGYGKAGSFEGFCSGGGIAQLAQTMTLERLQRGESVSFCPDIAALHCVDARAVAKAAGNGDELALVILSEVGRWLGRGLSLLIDILNPEVIVIGSVFERSGRFMVESMQQTLEAECLPRALSACRVVAAQLGDEIGDYATLAVAEQ